MDIDLFFEIIKHDTQGHLENFKSEISQNVKFPTNNITSLGREYHSLYVYRSKKRNDSLRSAQDKRSCHSNKALNHNSSTRRKLRIFHRPNQTLHI